MLVRDNKDGQRFELFDDGVLAGFIDYKIRDSRVWLVHTEIADEYKGTGAGAFLVRQTLDDIREQGVLTVPTCPFVAGWIRRHPDYQDLVDEPKFREFKRSRGLGRRRVVSRPPFDPTGKTIGQPCGHVPTDRSNLPAPWPADGCAECLEAGHRDWLHLRVCVDCGHVGCCDSSPGKHATAHSETGAHPLVRSYEPGERWWYCYVDIITFDIEGVGPARPATTS